MTPLDPLIALHRSMYRDELRGQMTQRSVPADTEPIQLSEYNEGEWRPGNGLVEVTDSGPLGGMPFHSDLNRRLGPADGWGPRYPWGHSWSWLRHACRNDHPGHTERPVFGGSLCFQVVSWCVVSEYSPQTITDLLGIPLEDTERHLVRAFRWIEEDIDRKQRIRNSRDPRPSEEPTPTRISLLQCDAVNRAVENFDLEQRIWEGQVAIMRRKLEEPINVLVNDPAPHYVTVSLEEWEQRHSWEAEWQRRQEALWDHRQECDRCRRAA